MMYSFVSTYTQALTCVCHTGWCYLFIVHMDLGVFGAALALNFTYILNYGI